MKTLCVFGGARAGSNPSYIEAARNLGAAIAERGFDLVYGGGKVGLMGEVADTALRGGATVIGVIPRFLAHDEVLHEQLTETYLVDDLFERKARMIELSDTYIAMPGGIGTIDEILEVIAWRQLGQIDSGIGLLDTVGYFQPWLSALRHAVEQGFVDVEHVDNIACAADVNELLDRVSRKVG